MIRRGLFIAIGIICWVVGIIFFLSLIDSKESALIFTVTIFFISIGSIISTRAAIYRVTIGLLNELWNFIYTMLIYENQIGDDSKNEKNFL